MAKCAKDRSGFFRTLRYFAQQESTKTAIWGYPIESPTTRETLILRDFVKSARKYVLHHGCLAHVFVLYTTPATYRHGEKSLALRFFCLLGSPKTLVDISASPCGPLSLTIFLTLKMLWLGVAAYCGHWTIHTRQTYPVLFVLSVPNLKNEGILKF